MIESAEEFIRLRTSQREDEYLRAAHEEAPLEIWWELVRSYSDMKFWVVANKTVPVPILEALSKDEDVSVRNAVARKGKATHAILERLATDPDGGVRLAVACNRRTPAEVLAKLLDDDWEVVASKAKARLEGPAKGPARE